MTDLSTHQGGGNFVAPQYGQRISIPTSEFTPEVQAKIVSSYFGNGDASAGYNELYNKFSQSSPVQNEQTVQPQPNAYEERIRALEAEINRMRVQPNTGQPVAPVQSNAQPVAQPNEATNQIDTMDKLLSEIFNTGQPASTPTTNVNTQAPVQNPVQEQQVQQPSQPQQVVDQLYNDVQRYATQYNHNAQDVMQFAKGLTAEDFVLIYDSYKKAMSQQSQPQVQQPVNSNQSISVTDMPKVVGQDQHYNVYGRTKHPVFG